MLRVLLLDDDGKKLQQVAQVLRDSSDDSVEILVAPDAGTARKALENTQFDLLIIDIVVPPALGEPPSEDVGYAFLEDLFDDDRLNMPSQIVGLTGYATLATNFSARFSEHGVLLLHYDPATQGWENALAMRTRQQLAARKAADSAPPDYRNKLGIVCALPLEFEPVRRLWDWKEHTIPGDPTLYYLADLRGGSDVNAVAAVSPRMGMSAAAVLATKLITNFRPEMLAMPGITAGIRGQVEIGDVLVAEQSWDWGMGKWVGGVADGPPQFQPAPHQFAMDSRVQSILAGLSSNQPFLDRVRSDWPASKPSAALNLRLGPIASGSAVIAAQDMTDHIRAQHRKLIGIDMEAYGMFTAADGAAYPKPSTIVIKGVCDFADEQKGDAYQHYCAYASATILKHFVDQFQ